MIESINKLKLDSQESRKEAIELLDGTDLSGVNENEEEIEVSITSEDLAITTYQKDGNVRINYYDKEGYDMGERFSGKWK